MIVETVPLEGYPPGEAGISRTVQTGTWFRVMGRDANCPWRSKTMHPVPTGYTEISGKEIRLVFAPTTSPSPKGKLDVIPF